MEHYWDAFLREYDLKGKLTSELLKDYTKWLLEKPEFSRPKEVIAYEHEYYHDLAGQRTHMHATDYRPWKEYKNSMLGELTHIETRRLVYK